MSDEKTKSKKGRSQNVMVTEQELPAVQLGVEVLTDNGQLELQKPPEKPFTIGDYSNLLAFGGDKKGAEEMTRKAKDALTKEGKQMAEDFQLIKRKEFINAENNINADKKEAEKKRLEEKADRKRRSRALAAEYNRRQEAGEDLTEFHGNIHPDSDLAQEKQGMQIAMRPKLAVNVMRVQFPLEVIEEINDHIDDTIIPNDVDFSSGLVGQIRQSERSKQLHFPHEGDEYGEQLNTVLLKLANE